MNSWRKHEMFKAFSGSVFTKRLTVTRLIIINEEIWTPAWEWNNQLNELNIFKSLRLDKHHPKTNPELVKAIWDLSLGVQEKWGSFVEGE